MKLVELVKKAENKPNIVIWGSLTNAFLTAHYIEQYGGKVVAFFDNQSKNWGKELYGHVVCCKPYSMRDEAICIMAVNEKWQPEIYRQATQLGFLDVYGIDSGELDAYKKNLDDETFLRLLWKYQMGTELDLEHPRTFNEKLQWLKLYDFKPEYTNMVDKYEAKKYIANMVGEEYVIPNIGICDSFDEINFSALPNRFVMKCTHDSGNVVLCKDKTVFDIEKARNKIEAGLARNFYYVGRERPYKNVKPRIIIEEYIGNDNTDLPDYKLMCFDGIYKMAFTCTERYSESGLKVTFFDTEWNILPFQRVYPVSKKHIEKPRFYEEMIHVAETLARGMKFLRVDFFVVNNRCYVGELTFYPGNGFEKFEPEEWDARVGEMLVIK